jgi:hypothetical protein
MSAMEVFMGDDKFFCDEVFMAENVYIPDPSIFLTGDAQPILSPPTIRFGSADCEIIFMTKNRTISLIELLDKMDKILDMEERR